jgi:hypothetical protein
MLRSVWERSHLLLRDQMRLALVTAFVLIALPAIANGQTGRIGVSSLQVAARTLTPEPAADFRYEPVSVFSTRAATLRSSVSAGHRHTGRGAVVGLLAGAIGGVAYGRSTNPGEMGRGYNEAVGAVGFGAIGAVCGALVGYAWRTNR